MSDYPDDLRYPKEHEWARIRGNIAQVGITKFAVEQLGDVTQLELPREVGSRGDAARFRPHGQVQRNDIRLRDLVVFQACVAAQPPEGVLIVVEDGDSHLRLLSCGWAVPAREGAVPPGLQCA